MPEMMTRPEIEASLEYHREKLAEAKARMERIERKIAGTNPQTS
jgi:hypothetical protein